jgi:hypothetical protein
VAGDKVAEILLEFGLVHPRDLTKGSEDTVVQVWKRLGRGGSDASNFPAAYR